MESRPDGQPDEKRSEPFPFPNASRLWSACRPEPRVLATRWGKQYWGTVGLVLSTDLLTLYLV